MAITRLGVSGIPRGLYGSFASKEAGEAPEGGIKEDVPEVVSDTSRSEIDFFRDSIRDYRIRRFTNYR